MHLLKIYSKMLTIETTKRFQVVKITREVENIVRESGVSEGVCLIHAPHATAAIILNEYEPRIVEDYIKWIVETFRPGGGWKHDEIDDNAHAHLASSFIGSGRFLPVSKGSLVRGTWQEIMLVELDGPRKRNIFIQVMGE
ncbi:MAG: secondary thiamine-phosphate synthase enzyme YjbQ [Sulfolobales archaeon]